MSKYYTGVGSRETPRFAIRAMTAIATFLEAEGYTLRSGGAGGADLAFEQGVIDIALKDIYLPERGFNKNPSPLYGVCDAALSLAADIHPAWDRCKAFARLLHARNCYQVLGSDLATPSDFLLCWTPDAGRIGGTRTAIVLAEQNNIPVLNFGKYSTTKQCVAAFEAFYEMYGQAA